MVTQDGLLKENVQEIIGEDELKQELDSGRPLNIKLGVDPTSPDLHFGHAVVLRKLRQFQEAGHQTYLIIGDFTASIGDPAGVNATRPVLTDAEIRHNLQTYLDQAGKILDMEQTHVVYNSQWLKTMNLSQFLGYTMKVSLQQIIERDDFRGRLDAKQTIGLHEVLYSLVQAIDSVHLKADVELGGWDQRLNLLMGRDLQQKLGYKPQAVVMMNLLIGTDGVKKMSKSQRNYIGLYEPASQMFAKIMRLPDELIDPYAESHQIDLAPAGAHPRDRKAMLAQKFTEIYHDAAAAKLAAEAFERTFRDKDVAAELVRPIDIGERSVTVIQAVTTSAGVSSSEARRLIEQGGVKINAEPATDPLAKIDVTESPSLQIGKHRFFKLSYKQE